MFLYWYQLSLRGGFAALTQGLFADCGFQTAPALSFQVFKFADRNVAATLQPRWVHPCRREGLQLKHTGDCRLAEASTPT